MSEKSCPKSVPGLTNMPKKYETGKPTRNILLLYGIGQKLSSILSPNGADIHISAY